MGKKFQVFLDALQKEYFQKLLLTGLKNTILIAVLGLLIGIILGTIIAMVKVAPKYKWYMKAQGCTGALMCFCTNACEFCDYCIKTKNV